MAYKIKVTRYFRASITVSVLTDICEVEYIFDTIEDAQDLAEYYKKRVSYLDHGELCRPDYQIISI